MNNDLETTIEDAVNDSLDTAAPVDDVATDTPVDAPAETTEVEAPDDVPAVDGNHPVAPGARSPQDVQQDEFARKFGLQAQSVTGRENRIPYSRVKKIVEKNEKDAIARVTRELETKFTPQVTELTSKVTDYESRLQRVAQFEEIMETKPKEFLGMLSKLPAYKDFFDHITKLASGTPVEQPKVADPSEGMPQPDQTLPDGSKVYSMEGLRALMDWQAAQVEQRTIKQVEERYKPIEQAWQSQEQYNKLVPVVEKQIAEARKWPNFTELETEIVSLLKANQNLTLEGAYREAYHRNVAPKLSADRDRIRQEVLAEIKKAPVKAPSAPVVATRPKPAVNTAPQSLEDIINASLEEAGLK
jgi:hypothetical protein